MNKITNYTDIFDFIKQQESAYKQAIPINDVWSWSMVDHIKTSDLYKNSQLLTGKSDFKPVKNITRPILNLQYRTEDIELKDVVIYINNPEKYHLSFLVKKYHDEVFARENDLDTFFDELNTSRIDFGAGLSKKLNKPCPEVVPLQSIAFCDQTDILSGPIGIKHYFSPDQLLKMGDVGWGDKNNGATISLDDLLSLSKEEKSSPNSEQKTKTPGRYVEIYEIHGNLPKKFANPTDFSNKYETRLFICAFYQKENSSEKQGVILYTAVEKESPFKLIKRDPVYGRALGFGGAEELFEAQVWVNYDMIRMQEMLDAASKVILKTTDDEITDKNKVRDMESLQVIKLQQGTDLSQIDTVPRSLVLFEKSVSQWEAHAQQMGAANDSIMGRSPASGTPFKLQELVTNESRGLHEYRRGQYAKHIEVIYDDWIIPHIQREIVKDNKFLSELSLDELRYVTDCVVDYLANKKIREIVFGGGVVPTEQEIETYKDEARKELKKRGNKYFLEIIGKEFSGSELKVRVDVLGKSKNLSASVDKITNIFRFIFSNPQGFMQVMQLPGMSKAFNEILEFSGLSPADFSGIEKLTQPPQAPQPQAPQELMMAGAQA